MSSSGSSTPRHERCSFQGMAIIEGERSHDPAPDTVNKDLKQDLRLYQKRNERRRRSSSLAQSDQIRDIIAKTVQELALKDSGNTGPQCKSAEDRLKECLASVKESGVSAEKIFSFFRPEASDADGQIDSKNCVSAQAFKDGLGKLGYQWQDADKLEDLIHRFDLNGDGLISLSEFEQYCLHEISSVAWKAERQRLEKAAAADDASDGSGSPRFDVKDMVYPPGPVVHATSKLFWKLSVSVDIELRYCSDLRVISMQVQHSETKAVLNTFFVNKADCGIDLEALEEKATLAVQSSAEKTDDGKDLVRKNVEWAEYSSYLVARLQMAQDEESYKVGLAKLHGDEYDRLDVQRPHNLQAPQIRGERKSADTKAIDDEFKTKFQNLRRDSRSARDSRQSAQELANVIESALSEVLAEQGMQRSDLE
ncbi:hypothetical protein ACHAXT_007772 [Thalassiosira profunda]